MEPPSVQYAKTSDGYDIAYGVTGSGRALIHTPIGWSNFSRFWHTFLGRRYEAFASRFRFIQYDSRGQGLSSRGLRDGHDIDEYVLDLEAVVDALKLEKFVLFGAAVLARGAVRYAVKHPERVEALVLWRYRENGRLAASPAMVLMATNDWPRFVEMIAKSNFPTDARDDYTPILMGTMTQDDWLKQMHALSDVEDAAILAQITVPTLLLGVRGGTSNTVTEEESRSAAALISGARLALFEGPGAGIEPDEDGNAPGIQAIEAFLAELDLARGSDTRGTKAGPFSAREREVLVLLSQGRSNREIAAKLVISEHTVARHVANILQKADVANRTEAAAFGRAHHLID